MPGAPEMLRKVLLFALPDDEESAVLAAQVEFRQFEPRHRIYRIGEPVDKARIVEVDRHDILALLQQKPHAIGKRGMGSVSVYP